MYPGNPRCTSYFRLVHQNREAYLTLSRLDPGPEKLKRHEALWRALCSRVGWECNLKPGIAVTLDGLVAQVVIPTGAQIS